ncbi:MAG: hypothetical protein RL701_2569 [Pseudomonadota bacterium]|jgi:ABC-type transporter Mla MlaB component
MQVRQHADHTTLLIRGPVRLGEVPQLLEHARTVSARALAVEVDLSEAEHLHTAAWQVLMALAQAAEKQQQTFRTIGASDNHRTMLNFLELGHWLPDQRGES